MAEVTLEKFDPAKHDSLVDELTSLLHSAYSGLAERGMRYWASYQSRAETLLRLNNGESYLAFLGDRLAGTINLRGPDPEDHVAWYRNAHVCSFHQFAVDPALQGQGIGAALLKKAEARAAELAFREIALDTAEQADHLIALYEKLGYRFVEYFRFSEANYRSVILSRTVP